MNKEELVSEYKGFLSRHPDLPADRAVLSAGGACVMLGLRESTDDVDLTLDNVLYEKYKTQFGLVPGSTYGDVNVTEKVAVHAFIEGETVMIDGVCCYSPRRLLAQKMALNRQKDQADINKLKALVAKEKS